MVRPQKCFFHKKNIFIDFSLYARVGVKIEQYRFDYNECTRSRTKKSIEIASSLKMVCVLGKLGQMKIRSGRATGIFTSVIPFHSIDNFRQKCTYNYYYVVPTCPPSIIADPHPPTSPLLQPPCFNSFRVKWPIKNQACSSQILFRVPVVD